MTHDEIWQAIDSLAARNDMSVSRLARQAGLDPTTFNKSKRLGTDGRPRWPSTESISKVLQATNSTLRDMMQHDSALSAVSLPLVASGMLEGEDLFDADGRPTQSGWNAIDLLSDDPHAWVLEVVSGDLEPLYPAGMRLIVSPTSIPAKGHHVILRTRGGELRAHVFVSRSADALDVIGPDQEIRTYDARDLVWVARVIWVSR